jgi:hypothetical protein
MISRLISVQEGESSGVSKTKRVMNLSRRKMQALINLVPNTCLTGLCFHMLFIKAWVGQEAHSCRRWMYR